jgi:hypothetical protein
MSPRRRHGIGELLETGTLLLVHMLQLVSAIDFVRKTDYYFLHETGQ